jgi:hypothetical protein
VGNLMAHLIEHLTARKIKFLKMAETVPYTNKELSMLKGMLDDVWINLNYNDPDYSFLQNLYEDVLPINCRGEDYFIDRPETEDLGLKGLNFMQYLLIYFPKVFIFLACVKPENAPLYLNKRGFRPIVTWRLKIAK